MIRKAVVDDIPHIARMAERMHAESPRISKVKFSRDKVCQVVALLIQEDCGLAIIDDELNGFALLVISGEWFSEDPIAQEIGLYVTPEKRGGMLAARLIKAMRNWSRDQGVSHMQAGCGTGLSPERTIRLYETLGFERCAIGVEYDFTKG